MLKLKDLDHSSKLSGMPGVLSRLAPTNLRRHLRSRVLGVADPGLVIEPELKEGIEPTTGLGGKPPLVVLSFVAFVVLPFIASALYFVFIASDQYTAEARFAVRTISREGAEDGVDSDTLSMSNVSQDAHIVTSFIHSTEILRRISQKLDPRAIFAKGDADFLSRLNEDDSAEEFLDYWNGQVSTYIDGPSGIVTLKVRTFRPEESTQLANVVIKESERLINELSDRTRQDVIHRFGTEVDRTAALYKASLQRMNEYQNSAGFLSPESQATQTGKLLTGLLEKKLEIDSRLFVLRQSLVEESPAYQQLSVTKQSLEEQLQRLQQELAGSSKADDNISRSILRFSQLETDRRVAEGLYQIARKNFESAQAEALRKALYVVVFVEPNVPEKAIYPRRLASPLLILLALTVGWVTIALVWASVEDHRL